MAQLSVFLRLNVRGPLSCVAAVKGQAFGVGDDVEQFLKRSCVRGFLISGLIVNGFDDDVAGRRCGPCEHVDQEVEICFDIRGIGGCFDVQVPAVSAGNDDQAGAVVDQMVAGNSSGQGGAQGVDSDAAEGCRVGGVEPEDGVFGQGFTEDLQGVRCDELQTGDVAEKMAGDDFPGQFHETKGPEQGAPLELGQLAGQQFAEDNAVAVQQQADPVFVALFFLESVKWFFRRDDPEPVSRWSGFLPALECAAAGSGTAVTVMAG